MNFSNRRKTNDSRSVNDGGEDSPRTFSPAELSFETELLVKPRQMSRMSFSSSEHIPEMWELAPENPLRVTPGYDTADYVGHHMNTDPILKYGLSSRLRENNVSTRKRCDGTTGIPRRKNYQDMTTNKTPRNVQSNDNLKKRDGKNKLLEENRLSLERWSQPLLLWNSHSCPSENKMLEIKSLGVKRDGTVEPDTGEPKNVSVIEELINKPHTEKCEDVPDTDEFVYVPNTNKITYMPDIDELIYIPDINELAYLPESVKGEILQDTDERECAFDTGEHENLRFRKEWENELLNVKSMSTSLERWRRSPDDDDDDDDDFVKQANKGTCSECTKLWACKAHIGLPAAEESEYTSFSESSSVSVKMESLSPLGEIKDEQINRVQRYSPAGFGREISPVAEQYEVPYHHKIAMSLDSLDLYSKLDTQFSSFSPNIQDSDKLDDKWNSHDNVSMNYSYIPPVHSEIEMLLPELRSIHDLLSRVYCRMLENEQAHSTVTGKKTQETEPETLANETGNNVPLTSHGIEAQARPVERVAESYPVGGTAPNSSLVNNTERNPLQGMTLSNPLQEIIQSSYLLLIQQRNSFLAIMQNNCLLGMMGNNALLGMLNKPSLGMIDNNFMINNNLLAGMTDNPFAGMTNSNPSTEMVQNNNLQGIRQSSREIFESSSMRENNRINTTGPQQSSYLGRRKIQPTESEYQQDLFRAGNE